MSYSEQSRTKTLMREYELTHPDADLAEEEADSDEKTDLLSCLPVTTGTLGARLVGKVEMHSMREIGEGCVDALGQDAMQSALEVAWRRQQTERLVSLHYGHGGLAAGGRKRADVD